MTAARCVATKTWELSKWSAGDVRRETRDARTPLPSEADHRHRPCLSLPLLLLCLAAAALPLPSAFCLWCSHSTAAGAGGPRDAAGTAPLAPCGSVPVADNVAAHAALPPAVTLHTAEAHPPVPSLTEPAASAESECILKQHGNVPLAIACSACDSPAPPNPSTHSDVAANTTVRCSLASGRLVSAWMGVLPRMAGNGVDSRLPTPLSGHCSMSTSCPGLLGACASHHCEPAATQRRRFSASSNLTSLCLGNPALGY